MINKKIGRNELCPCGTGQKFKRCCEGKVDWDDLFKTGKDWRPYQSMRGRNLQFVQSLAEIFQLDNENLGSLSDYKKAFTSKAVKEIHEAILQIWPPDTDIKSILESTSDYVSGLYIGDYDIEYLSKAVVRHSIYANKILVVDPFIYPLSMKDEYNPILEPAQYKTQTLINVNFWIRLLPWIDSGLIEIIRTPAHFDPVLNWESMKRQKQKFEDNAELRAALDLSTAQMEIRHLEKQRKTQAILIQPDAYIEKLIKKLNLEKPGYSATEFLKYIHTQREQDPNFLEPLDSNAESRQLTMLFSGASYEIAQLTASLTQSYLVTDMSVRWREIEIDRSSNNAESLVWSPFAKAFQEAPLKFLNNLKMEHALKLRKEGRLESLRGFLLKVWKHARTEEPFDEANAILLAEEFNEEISLAQEEWKIIRQDLVKIIGQEVAGGLLAAGPLIASGHGMFLAAAGVTAGMATLARSLSQYRRFPDRFPAAFFMNIEGQ